MLNLPEATHDMIGQAVTSMFPQGLTLQELDLDNLSSVYLSEFFLDPAHVEILTKASIK